MVINIKIKNPSPHAVDFLVRIRFFPFPWHVSEKLTRATRPRSSAEKGVAVAGVHRVRPEADIVLDLALIRPSPRDDTVSHDDIVSRDEDTVSHDDIMRRDEDTMSHDDNVSRDEDTVSHDDIVRRDEDTVSHDDIMSRDEDTVSHDDIVSRDEDIVSHDDDVSRDEDSVSHDDIVSRDVDTLSHDDIFVSQSDDSYDEECEASIGGNDCGANVVSTKSNSATVPLETQLAKPLAEPLVSTPALNLAKRLVKCPAVPLRPVVVFVDDDVREHLDPRFISALRADPKRPRPP